MIFFDRVKYLFIERERRRKNADRARRDETGSPRVTAAQKRIRDKCRNCFRYEMRICKEHESFCALLGSAQVATSEDEWSKGMPARVFNMGNEGIGWLIP